MRAIILAGGLGTRLRPLTLTTPKPLLPLLNKPMIDWLMEKLKGWDVIVTGGYKRELMEKHFEGAENVTIVEEKKLLGTGGALKNIESRIKNAFLVFNSDVITSLSVDDFIKFHRDKGGIGSISLFEVAHPKRYGIVELDKNEKIKRFEEKPTRIFSRVINAGTYMLEREIFEYIPTNKTVSIEHDVFPKLIGRLYGYKFEGYWLDIGKPEDYINAHLMLMQLEGKKFALGKNCVVEGSLSYSCVGKDVRIGKGRLSRSVVMEGSSIGDDVVIENAVLGKNCKVGEHARIRDSILGDNVWVKKNAVLSKAKIKPSAVVD